MLSEPFMKLPPKKDYPDYYEVIKKPLDINKILNRIEDGKVFFTLNYINNNNKNDMKFTKLILFISVF